VASAIGIPLLRETYGPIIRLRKAKGSADPEKLAYILAMSNGQEDKLHYLWVNLSRPLTMLVRSFICFVLSLYMALYVSYLSSVKHADPNLCCIVYMVRICVYSSSVTLRIDSNIRRHLLLDVCYLRRYVSFVSVATSFSLCALPEFFSSTYGFSPGIGGLAYLGLGVGFLLATFTGAKFADQIYKYVCCFR
jgi:hypothetical protein